MKTVKIYFTGFWKSFNFEDNMFMYILKKRYTVVLDSQNPDFVICSPLGNPYEYMKYDCPRIMYTGEFLSADFNAIDYFIGYDNIEFGDRSFRFPLFLWSDTGIFASDKPLSHDEAVKELHSKEYFCNYIFGHDTALGKREQILELLQKYKRVECAGKHRNNMPNNEIYTIRTKRQLMKKCKFSITAESVCYPGYTSEKIVDAFRVNSIPIYFGDPTISNDFNTNSFIDCLQYDSIEKAVEKVIEIDQNDDLYVDMLCEYRYKMLDYENIMFKKLEDYLYHIFDQDKEEAYRRPRFYRAGWHETYLKEYNKHMLSIPHRILKKLGI